MGHFLHKLPQIPAALLIFARFGRNDGWAGRGAERLFSVFLPLVCDFPQNLWGALKPGVTWRFFYVPTLVPASTTMVTMA